MCKSNRDYVEKSNTEINQWINEVIDNYGFISDFAIYEHLLFHTLGLEHIGLHNREKLDELRMLNTGYIRENGKLMHVIQRVHTTVTYTYEPIVGEEES